MKRLYILLLVLPVLVGCQYPANTKNTATTICNPLPLNYNFAVDGVSRRDAAQPCIVLFQDSYYLFMSNAGGYYHSNDLIHWDLITTNLPIGGNAPTVVEIEGSLYYTFSDGTNTFYKTNTPMTGEWEVVTDSFPYDLAEPALFYDNGHLFLYAGSGNKVPLTGMEIDPQTFLPLTAPVPLINSCKENNGWEVAGDYHRWKAHSLWIEGAWMTKFNNKYYLQYASSGIQYTGSNQGVYVSDHPMGPFTLASHNPYAYKPDGFITGAGNGCVFQDKHGNYWYVGTVAVTAKNTFERRLSLYPVFFDADDVLYAYTGMGDYPMIVPDRKISSPEELFPGWMLLSYHKKTQTSSEQRKYPACCAVDENIRSWWSANTGNEGEYLSIDLGEECAIHAVQINFSDHDSNLYGSTDSTYQYYLEASTNGKRWKPIADQSLRITGTPHDYIPLKKPLKGRYLRVTNVRFPSGKFSVSGFRVFGHADKPAPNEVGVFRILRNESDRRDVTLRWKEVNGAIGYNIRYGTSPDKLYHNYIVYDDTEITIRSLHTESVYYFTIDSFNEGGITRGNRIEKSI